MEKHVVFKTEGVCSRAIEFDIVDGAVVNAITYANGFDKNGVAFTKCARCDETSEGEVAPIFEAKGYALNSDRTGLNGGYKINTEMLLAYETINGSLNFGIVIANANSFGGAKFFNDENKVNSEKSIVAEAKENFQVSIAQSTDLAHMLAHLNSLSQCMLLMLTVM